jgi:predicted nucleic acid-binding protein
MPFTLISIKDDLEDIGSRFDGAPDLEFRAATKPLQLERSALSYQWVPPGYRFPYGHTHREQEEVYVVLRGSGRMKLDDEIVELEPWDTVRVPPGTWRGYEAGPEGLEAETSTAGATGGPTSGAGRAATLAKPSSPAARGCAERDVATAACSVRAVTRFVVDCETLLRIAAGEVQVADGHQLVAPTLVRSQALAALYAAARRAEISAAEGIERVTRINSLKVRFLGDKVLQRQAWKVADELGWETTYDAEYVALTQLQADALVTSDDALASAASNLVRTASPDALGAPPTGS